MRRLLVLGLIAIGVHCQQVDSKGFRRSRQLDLGFQDIKNEKEEKSSHLPPLPAVRNEYLPPSSPSSDSQKPVGAQTQILNLKFPTPVENDLCRPPFDPLFCDPKAALSKTEEFGIAKPSVDLIPPINDLEQQPRTTGKQQEPTKAEDFSVFSAVSHSTFSSTTRKPPSKVTQLASTTVRSTSGISVASTSSKAEATNESRSYLPPQPEYSEAAQTSIGVARPPEQNEKEHHHHDHDHHHHHHHTGNICDDPFHAFLCAPLKARRRITGALPNALKGQSSFVQYQKVLPNADKKPSSSNTFQNEYLPPKPASSSSNAILSTSIPPQTTSKQIVKTTTSQPFISQSSINNDRSYLLPLTDSKLNAPSNEVQQIQVLPTTKPLSTTTLTNHKITYQFKSNSPVFVSVTTPRPASPKTLFPAAATPSFQYSSSTHKLIVPAISTFSSLLSNEERSYLPPRINPLPAASVASTTRSALPTVSTLLPAPVNIIPLAPLQKLETASSTIKKPVSTTLQPQITSAFVAKTSQHLKPEGGYLPPKPKIESASNVFSTTLKPSTLKSLPEESNLPLQPKFQSSSTLISTTLKPVTKISITTTSKFIPQPSSQDRSYLPPELNVQPAAAQINAAAVAAPQVKNPFHHGRDLCTDPFHSFLCVGPKPRKRITGAFPNGFKPDSSNTNELRVQPASSFQNENLLKLDSAQAQNIGYSYPKTSNLFPAQSNTVISTTVAPITGYSYLKPEKKFPLPSEQKQIKTVTTKRPHPVITSTLKTSEAKVVSGYDYPKPEQKLTLPTAQVISTLKPSSTGYLYSKPFPSPTEKKEVKSANRQIPAIPVVLQPANEVKGYSYPKPEQSFNLPQRKGYSYPKPEKRLELPTESQSKSVLPQTNSKLDLLKDLGSAEFIPVNKLDKREQPTGLLSGLRKFGERLIRRERKV